MNREKCMPRLVGLIAPTSATCTAHYDVGQMQANCTSGVNSQAEQRYLFWWRIIYRWRSSYREQRIISRRPVQRFTTYSLHLAVCNGPSLLRNFAYCSLLCAIGDPKFSCRCPNRLQFLSLNGRNRNLSLIIPDQIIFQSWKLRNLHIEKMPQDS